MNLAALATTLTIIGCGVTAGLVAASQKAGWFTALFVVAGFTAGFGFACVVHKVAYRLLAGGARQTGALIGWSMLFAYATLPLLLAFGAMAATGWLTFFFTRYVL